MDLKFITIIFFLIKISQQTLPGNSKSNSANTMIAPVQMPGILNPDVYVENTQSNPIIPHIKNPPINMKLHIDGLDKYYKPDPVLIQNEIHVHPSGSADEAVNKLQRKQGSPINIKVNINPERYDSPEDLADPSNHYYISNLLNSSSFKVNRYQQEQLINQIDQEMKLLQLDYQNLNQGLKYQSERLSNITDRYIKYREGNLFLI